MCFYIIDWTRSLQKKYDDIEANLYMLHLTFLFVERIFLQSLFLVGQVYYM